jgi:hypothetical protein
MTRGVTILGAVSALIAGSTATAVAQGPGAGNPGPNVLNYGCSVYQALLVGLEPPLYITQSSPGVYIQDLQTGEVREVRLGDSCTVGFGPPPPGPGPS